MLRDLRYALLLVAKEPWYSAVAVLALSLGIGLNATVFTLVNAVLIRGLPFKDSDRLLVVGSQFKNGGGAGGVSLPDLADFRAQSHTFSALAAYDGNSMNLSDDVAPPQQARGVRLSANAFGVLGQRLLLGRDFAADDERAGALKRVPLHDFASHNADAFHSLAPKSKPERAHDSIIERQFSRSRLLKERCGNLNCEEYDMAQTPSGPGLHRCIRHGMLYDNQ